LIEAITKTLCERIVETWNPIDERVIDAVVHPTSCVHQS